MPQYATARTAYVAEKEVFIGTIIGRSGAGSKSQTEHSDYMRAHFNQELRDTRSWMDNHSQVADTADGLLCLAVACLYLAAKTPSEVSIGKLGPLRSFGWFAAGMCVPELVREDSELSSWASTLAQRSEKSQSARELGKTLQDRRIEYLMSK